MIITQKFINRVKSSSCFVESFLTNNDQGQSQTQLRISDYHDFISQQPSRATRVKSLLISNFKIILGTPSLSYIGAATLAAAAFIVSPTLLKLKTDTDCAASDRINIIRGKPVPPARYHHRKFSDQSKKTTSDLLLIADVRKKLAAQVNVEKLSTTPVKPLRPSQIADAR